MLKRWFLKPLLWLLVAVATATAPSAQVLQRSPGGSTSLQAVPQVSGNGACAVVSDTDVQAWCAAVGFSNTTVGELTTLNTMVAGLKSDAVWASLDRLWIFATVNRSAAKVDLVARSTLTEQANGGTLTWTTLKGYAGDGTASYIDTGFNPTSGSPHYAQNSAFYATWVQTATGGTTGTYASNSANGGASRTSFKASSASAYAFGIQSSGSTGSFTWSTATGFFAPERSAASVDALYQAGASVATDAISSTTVANATFFCFATNTAGTPSLFASSTQSAFAAGAGLGATKQSNLYSRLHTALHAISATNFP